MADRAYKIVTDSTCDLPDETVKALGIDILNLTYEVDGVDYAGNELPIDAFYEKMRKGSVTRTSQITPETYRAYFERQILDGFDILYLGFSSALSGSYQSAITAAAELSEQYPQAKLYPVDTLSASLGEGLLVYLTCQKKGEGLDIDALREWVINTRLHLCHVFTVDDLHFLHRGGRVSKTAAIAGSILGIKPMLHVDDEGRLVPVSKIRGRKQSLARLVEMMEERKGTWENKTIAICHGDCRAEADEVAQLAKKILGKNTEVIIGHTGPVIGSHSGPGTMALFFLGAQR
ncbi:MAG: DegV family protein [Oscillospiraceae bacterium]